ncbi:hypothetical protein ACET3Z_016141 [Daucus carota]
MDLLCKRRGFSDGNTSVYSAMTWKHIVIICFHKKNMDMRIRVKRGSKLRQFAQEELGSQFNIIAASTGSVLETVGGKTCL